MYRNAAYSKENNSMLRYRGGLIYSGLCILLSIILVFLARNFGGFSQWYSTNISPFFVNTLGRFFSLFPFSVFEFMLYGAALYVLIYIFIGIFFLIKKPRDKKNRLAAFCVRTLCILSSLLLIFNITAAVNYHKPVLSAGSDTTVREYSRGELMGLALLLIDDINELSATIPTDDQDLLKLDGIDLHALAIGAMENLGERYPSLKGYYPSAKPVLLSKGMSYLGITGIFSPFTLEANYNRDVASYIIPYTICHELAHLKGFMREDEAGFLAYLAAANSDSPQYRYSGTLNALTYTLGELYKNVDISIYEDVYLSIPERVRAEIAHSRDYWQNHKVTMTTVAKKANDKYLMANAQSGGTNSYGMMVDFLLKEYDGKILDKYIEKIPPQLLTEAETAERN